MPMYEYKCGNCGKRFERIQKFADEPLTVHDECGAGPVERLISVPSLNFKGTGWYVTDYAKNGGNAAGSDAKSKSEGSDSGKSESSKSEGKSDSGKSDNTKSDSGKSEGTKSEASKSEGSKSESSSSPKSDSPSPAASPSTRN